MFATSGAPTLAADRPVEVVSLAPSSHWHVDYADDSCRLTRIFGEGDEKVAFYIERYEPGDRMFLVVAGKPVEGNARGSLHLQFGPNEQRANVEAIKGEFGNFTPALIVSHAEFAPAPWQRPGYRPDKKPDVEDEPGPDMFGQDFPPEREAAIEWLAVERQGGKRVILELGPMGEPMEAMRACTDELLTHWGVDLAQHRKLTRAAEPRVDPGRWIGPSDYPSGLLSKGAQGIVQFRLSIDSDGKPSACHIQKSTRPEGFDDAVCRLLMRRARFKPALGENGEPIASFWRNTVRFEIPH